jgi:dihydrofolate reductase
MIISIIAAVAENNAIGKDNKLLWHLKADLKRFKHLTIGKMVIMGRKTYESMGKALPNRINVILSFDKNFKAENCLVFHDLNEALRFAGEKDLSEVFIIGGSSIYEQAMDIADKMYITQVHCAPSADAFFPKYSLEDWDIVDKEFIAKDADNDYDSTYYELEM